MNKCYLSSNSSNIKLLGFIFLILILIFTIGYYIYISYYYKNKKNKDINIENFACRTVEQSQMDVSMRDCAIYFTKDTDYCDKYIEYYKMGQSQLEALQTMNKDHNNTNPKKEIYDAATNILNQKFLDPNGLNNKSCKISISGWKEINTIENSNTSNGIYSRKNTNIEPNDYEYLGNILLWGTCFKEINKDSDLSKGPMTTESIVRMCDPSVPITNIKDVNNTVINQEYMAVDFKSLNPDELITSFCSSFPSKNTINIQDKQKFIRIASFFINNNMKTNNVSIVYYDKYENKFFPIDQYNVYSEYLKLFRFLYDGSDILFGPLRRNVKAKILFSDECGKYVNATNMDCFFSLSDFKIENKFIATAETLKFSNNIPISEYIDYKDYIEDKVNRFVTDLLAKNVKLDKDSTDLSATKKELEKELNELIILRNNKPDTFTIPYTVENPLYASLQSQIRLLQNNLGDNPPTLSKNVPVTNSQVAIEKSKLDRLNKDLINTNQFIHSYIPNLYLKTFKYRNMGKWGENKSGVDHFLRHREIIEGPPAPRLIGDINVFDPDYQENMIHVFEGTINIEIDAYYNFILDGDDDCELFINNKLVSHYYGGHGRANQSYTTEYAIYIEAGIYPIMARMLEWWGASSITAYFIASTKEELDKAHGKQPTYTLNSDFQYIHNSYRRTKPVQTLLQINGPNRTNYVFVQKIAEPNPLYPKLQDDIRIQENILKNTPSTVDNYITVTNSIYTDIQNQINSLQTSMASTQPLLGRTRTEVNDSKILLSTVIITKENILAILNTALQVIQSKMQANLELKASISSLKTYLINGPNINEVNNIIKEGVTLDNLDNYQKCISTDNNIYITINY